MSEATAFEIKEVTGPDGREILLTERALPIGPYELRGTMRAETTHYPGNPDATIQVLGPKEEPTTVEGAWSDRFLGAAPIMRLNGSAVTSARDAARLLDDVRRKGQLLKVSWDETVRYGVLTEFVQRWLRGQDVEWEMEFTWVSQDRKDAISPVVASSATPDSVTTSVASGISAAITQNSAGGVLGDVMADAQAAVAGIRRGLAEAANLSNQMQGLVSQTARFVATPANIARQTAGLALAIASQLQTTLETEALALRAAYQFEGTTGSTTAGFGTGDAGATAINPENNAPAQGDDTGTAPGSSAASETGKVLLASLIGVAKVGATTGPSATGKALAAAVWGVTNEHSIRALRRSAAVQGRDLVTEQERDLVAIYVARAGDDLRDVARLYYGDQRFWRDLKAFNDLDGSALTRGQAVFVPRPEEATA